MQNVFPNSTSTNGFTSASNIVTQPTHEYLRKMKKGGIEMMELMECEEIAQKSEKGFDGSRKCCSKLAAKTISTVKKLSRKRQLMQKHVVS
jgi:hypothetical protein